MIETMKAKILAGESLQREDARILLDAPLEALCAAADEIRFRFCGNKFDLCTIVNGKSGRCSEDCKYCAQSIHYQTDCAASDALLPTEALVAQAVHDAEQGALRYSIVTSGKRLSAREVGQLCESIRAIRARAGIQVCVSLGLLDEEQFIRLKAAGASRVHCNLETSEQYFPRICTTHTWQEKVDTLKAAQRAGLDICSGGIMGLGETMEHRIDMVLALRQLGVKSVPVNLLNPIPGTPCGSNPILSYEELRRVTAIFRFLIPDGFIRLAGGRGLLADKGEACFRGGANAVISGDMLTTAGYTVKTDLAMLEKLGYEVELTNG